MARLIAAVSGGVDSAVATAQLLQAGHQVTAVHMRLADVSPAAVTDAALVADNLGVPFEVWDLSDQFNQQVLNYFASEYSAGRTPNPCVMCNRTIKFGALLQRALTAGFDGVATGHYARLTKSSAGVTELHRAADLPKDQSYVLSMLRQDELSRVWLPLGGLTKQEVRALASVMELPVASRQESMDLCFIEDGDTTAWLASRLGVHHGQIVDEAGVALGEHDGTYRFTIGQRKGLNLRQPASDGQPRFVLGIDAAKQQVVVGPRAHLAVESMVTGQAVWTSGVAASGPLEVSVQVRAHGVGYPGVVTPLPDGSTRIDLDETIPGVAPGQTAAFYVGDQVVGSSTITQTERAWRSAQGT